MSRSPHSIRWPGGASSARWPSAGRVRRTKEVMPIRTAASDHEDAGLDPGPVVSHRGPGIGVRGRFLHVPCGGAVILAILGMVHALPLAASTREGALLGHRTSWAAPVIGIGVMATAPGYTMGIVAVRYLGPKLASFIGMSEVLFAAAFSWAALGQIPSGAQFAGGAFILAGLALVRRAAAFPAATCGPEDSAPTWEGPRQVGRDGQCGGTGRKERQR
jgi:EamA-like transporter family